MMCLVCYKPEGDKKPLHLIQSFRLYYLVKTFARTLNDSLLHPKLQDGDLVAKDAKYHLDCLNQLYRNTSNI